MHTIAPTLAELRAEVPLNLRERRALEALCAGPRVAVWDHRDLNILFRAGFAGWDFLKDINGRLLKSKLWSITDLGRVKLGEGR